jgi:hypothetical protein
MSRVHKATREAAGARFGDSVRVEFEVDDAPRQVVVPAELAAALDAEPALRVAFDNMAPSRRREPADGVAQAGLTSTPDGSLWPAHPHLHRPRHVLPPASA